MRGAVGDYGRCPLRGIAFEMGPGCVAQTDGRAEMQSVKPGYSVSIETCVAMPGPPRIDAIPWSGRERHAQSTVRVRCTRGR